MANSPIRQIQINDQVYDIGAKWENIVDTPNSKFLHVEDYGAKGDGVTDDYSALQAAINDSINNNKMLIFSPGKIYCTTHPLDFYFPEGGKYNLNATFDFGGATIKAIHANDSQDEPLEYIIKVYDRQSGSFETRVIFKNLRLDGNFERAHTGLFIPRTYGGVFENIKIYNTRRGVYLIQGTESTLRKIYTKRTVSCLKRIKQLNIFSPRLIPDSAEEGYIIPLYNGGVPKYKQEFSYSFQSLSDYNNNTYASQYDRSDKLKFEPYIRTPSIEQIRLEYDGEDEAAGKIPTVSPDKFKTVDLSKTECIGIESCTDDGLIQDCVSVDYIIGLKNDGSDNKIYGCHNWNLGLAQLRTAVCFYTGHQNYYTDCTCDRFRYGFYLARHDTTIHLENCLFTNSTTLKDRSDYNMNYQQEAYPVKDYCFYVEETPYQKDGYNIYCTNTKIHGAGRQDYYRPLYWINTSSKMVNDVNTVGYGLLNHMSPDLKAGEQFQIIEANNDFVIPLPVKPDLEDYPAGTSKEVEFVPPISTSGFKKNNDNSYSPIISQTGDYKQLARTRHYFLERRNNSAISDVKEQKTMLFAFQYTAKFGANDYGTKISASIDFYKDREKAGVPSIPLEATTAAATDNWVSKWFIATVDQVTSIALNFQPRIVSDDFVFKCRHFLVLDLSKLPPYFLEPADSIEYLINDLVSKEDCYNENNSTFDKYGEPLSLFSYTVPLPKKPDFEDYPAGTDEKVEFYPSEDFAKNNDGSYSPKRLEGNNSKLIGTRFSFLTRNINAANVKEQKTMLLSFQYTAKFGGTDSANVSVFEDGSRVDTISLEATTTTTTDNWVSKQFTVTIDQATSIELVVSSVDISDNFDFKCRYFLVLDLSKLPFYFYSTEDLINLLAFDTSNYGNYSNFDKYGEPVSFFADYVIPLPVKPDLEDYPTGTSREVEFASPPGFTRDESDNSYYLSKNLNSNNEYELTRTNFFFLTRRDKATMADVKGKKTMLFSFQYKATFGDTDSADIDFFEGSTPENSIKTGTIPLNATTPTTDNWVSKQFTATIDQATSIRLTFNSGSSKKVSNDFVFKCRHFSALDLSELLKLPLSSLENSTEDLINRFAHLASHKNYYNENNSIFKYGETLPLLRYTDYLKYIRFISLPFKLDFIESRADGKASNPYKVRYDIQGYPQIQSATTTEAGNAAIATINNNYINKLIDIIEINRPFKKINGKKVDQQRLCKIGSSSYAGSRFTAPLCFDFNQKNVQIEITPPPIDCSWDKNLPSFVSFRLGTTSLGCDSPLVKSGEVIKTYPNGAIYAVLLDSLGYPSKLLPVSYSLTPLNG